MCLGRGNNQQVLPLPAAPVSVPAEPIIDEVQSNIDAEKERLRLIDEGDNGSSGTTVLSGEKLGSKGPS